MIINIENKIALGTVQFGLDYGISNHRGHTSLKEIQKILQFCRDKGITMLDTAAAYGKSETTLGKFNLNKFKVVSKFILDKNDVNALAKKSISCLGVKTLYGYLYHRPLEATKENWQQLQNLQEQELIYKIGFSFNTIDEANYVLDKNFIPNLIQIPFNVFDNRFAEVATQLKNKHNTEIHTRSTFLQGLFFINSSDLDEYFGPIKSIVADLQYTYKEDLAVCLMEYVLRQPFVDKVVLGVNNQEQLNANIESLLNFSTEKLLKPISVEDKYIIPSSWKI